MKGSDAPIRKVSSGKKRWVVDFRYVGGQRQFFSTESEAKVARGAKMALVKSHGAAALSLPPAKLVEYCMVEERLKAIGMTILEAVDFCERHHKPSESILISAALERFIAGKVATEKDPEYVRILEGNLAGLMTALGDQPVSSVTRDDLEGWLFGNGWAAATVNNKRIDVSTFFRYAVGRKWITLNPAEEIEAIAIGDKPIGILSVDETEALLQAALAEYPVFLPYAVLGLFCGLRADEATQLVPANIQIERGYVEVTAEVAKSRKRRLVEISANARAWLALCGPIKPRPHGWHSNRLQVLRPKAAVLLAAARGVESIEFPWPKNCLRHSFGSYHLAMHGSADKTALQMGHRSTDMLFRHYRELVEKSDAEKFWNILPLK